MPGLSPAESLNAPVPRATISAARPCRLALRTLPIILRQKDNVVLNSLHVRVTTGTAISCFNSTNVRLKNLKIEHAAEQGSGIYFDRCHGLHIEDVSIASIGASRPNTRCRKPYSDCDSINGVASRDISIKRARLRGGSTGIELHDTPQARLTDIVVLNTLGPYPRGQCVQFSQSDGASLDRFHCFNDPAKSWTEDSISVWRSAHVKIANGLVDGNNSPTGVGVMFENDDPHAVGGLIDNVDAIHMGNGCFSGYPARGLRMTHCRCGWNRCGGQGGRAPPMSHGRMWAAWHPTADQPDAAQMINAPKPRDGSVTSRGIIVAHSRYWQACNRSLSPSWASTEDAYASVQIKEQAFVPRPPISLRFCFELAGAEGTSLHSLHASHRAVSSAPRRHVDQTGDRGEAAHESMPAMQRVAMASKRLRRAARNP